MSSSKRRIDGYANKGLGTNRIIDYGYFSGNSSESAREKKARFNEFASIETAEVLILQRKSPRQVKDFLEKNGFMFSSLIIIKALDGISMVIDRELFLNEYKGLFEDASKQ